MKYPFPVRCTRAITRRNLARVLRTATEPLTAEALAAILCGDHRVRLRHVERCRRLMTQPQPQE